MPAEQVNAWASYDQTATAARNFSNRSGSTQTGGVRHRKQAGRHSLSSLYELEDKKNVPAGFFEAMILEQGASARKLEDTEIKKKKQVLPKSVLSDIREILPGFFDETLGHSETKKPESRSLLSFIKSFNATMPWVHSNVESEAVLFVEMCFRGICQIYFQNNPLSGLLFLAGFFVQSSRVAVHGVIGVISSTLFALMLGFNKDLAMSGLFGYNGVLAGLAIATFDSAEKHQGYKVTIILATVVASLTTSILLVMLGKLLVPYKSPPLTFPFNISVLFFLLAVAGMGHVDYSPVRTPALPVYDAVDSSGITARAFFAGMIRGVGQVCLCDNIISGILILAGITVCSRISAVAAIVGSGIGAAVALLLGVPGSQIEQGMFGFNASLSFTAMYMFYTPSTGAAVLGTLSAGLTVIAQLGLATALEPLGLPFMTVPFCVVALAFILIQGTTSVVIAVPLATMTTPEDHLRRVKMLWDGFEFLKESIDTSSKDDKITRSSSKNARISRVKSRKITRSLSMLGEAIEEAEETRESAGKTKEQKTKKQQGCWGTVDKEAALRVKAASVFRALDENGQGHIPLQTISDAMQVAGLSDEEQLHFATLILSLMDLDGSATIELPEFTAFVIVAASVHVIRTKISRFFDFVDADGNGDVSFEEFNAALDYLGEKNISEAEMNDLRRLTNSLDESIDIVALINAVTVAKVKVFVDAYHGSTVAATNSFRSDREMQTIQE